MDVSAKEIVFDSEGVCNFCANAQKMLKEIEGDKAGLQELLDTELRDAKGKYDCLIGLSGGVDSSYALHQAVKLGLRPLCFSIDNGWNDPRADENIMRMVETLKVPFFRYTIDLKRFKMLQSAFMMAGVKNLEIPTDHILMASTYEMADKYGIKTIISGGNVTTESIMPASWGYNARDLVHIKAIYKQFCGGRDLAGLPTCSLFQYNVYKWLKGIKTVYLLDYLDYNRDEAIKTLENVYGYKPYGEKHCESVFTWWFQNWYLFTKFGIDKRKAHLSSLINSGQMTREDAMTVLEKNPEYPKFGIEDKVLGYPRHEYTDYPTDEKLYNFIGKVIKFFK